MEPIHPLRIDICIEDPNDLPLDWRHGLQTSPLCYVTDPGSNHPLIQRILQVLERWTEENEKLETELLEVPFGSVIVLDPIATVWKHPRVNFQTNLERKWMSLSELKGLWFPYIEEESFPPTLDISELEVVNQLQDSITLVRIPSQRGVEVLVFKSSTNGTHYLYHELKVLLSIPPHEGVLGPPLYIVTMTCNFGGKVGVCGFILPYYSRGSLRESIPNLRQRGLECVLKIAVQILNALIHLKENGGVYCSDLRPDNIILSEKDGSDCALLIDFEQRGNWYAWSPPEIYALQSLQSLIKYHRTPEEDKARYRGLLSSVRCSYATISVDSKYKLQHGGANDAWNSLSDEQQESATVYIFGKLLWCLLEGVSTVSSFDNLWRTSPDDKDAIEFPEFKNTPDSLRQLILDCTNGSPEREGRYPVVIRDETKIGLRTSRVFIDQTSAIEILESSTGWWKEELERSKDLLEGRKDCFPANSYISMPFFDRPTLAEIHEKLQNV
jgi:hypothetical protein